MGFRSRERESLLQVSPDLGGSEFGVLGMVSLGPGGGDIDGHQTSYNLSGIMEARSLDKKISCGSAEPRLRGDAWRLMPD